MIPAAVGEIAGGGRAIGERAGIHPGVAASGVAVLGVAASAKDSAFAAQLRQSWHEELTEQLTDQMTDQSGRLTATSPPIANDDFGSAPGGASGPVSGMERATAQVPATGLNSGLVSTTLPNTVSGLGLALISSPVSGRVFGADTAPDAELDSEPNTPEGGLDSGPSAGHAAKNANPQPGLKAAKTSVAPWIAPRHVPLANRAGAALAQPFRASVRIATPGYADPIEKLEKPVQRAAAAHSAGHASGQPVHRPSSDSGSAQASLTSPTHSVEIIPAYAAAGEPSHATQGLAASAATELGGIATPPYSARGNATAGSPPEPGSGSFSSPGSVAPSSRSWPDTISAVSIAAAAAGEKALPGWREDSGQTPKTPAGLLPTQGELAGQAALQPFKGASVNQARSASAHDAPTLGIASPPALDDSRKLPLSAAEILSSSTRGVVRDASSPATNRPADQNRVPSSAASPIAAAPVASTSQQASSFTSESITHSHTGSFTPPISANTSSATPPHASVALASPSPQTISGPAAVEPHPDSTEPSHAEGVRPVETQSAPLPENGGVNRISAAPELADTANGNLAALPQRSAENPIAAASLAAQASAPALATPLPSGADMRANRIVDGPSRPPGGSRPAAISAANLSGSGDAAMPGTAQIAHMLPNIAPSLAPNPESRADLPAWTLPAGRGEANPNPFQVIDAVHTPNAAMPASAASIWASQGAGIPSAYPASGGSQLQVGYQDPVLGYVELHAHSDGNGVHASLGTQSEAGRAVLSGDLNDLAAWMDARHTPVESLSVVALHGVSNTPSSLGGGHSAHEESGGGGSAANGGGSELSLRNGAGAGFGADLGSGSGHRAGSGSQNGPDAAQVFSIGRRSGFGPESSPSLEDSGIGPVAEIARDDGFAIGGSISILA